MSVSGISARSPTSLTVGFTSVTPHSTYMHTRVPALALLAVVVLAGCAAPLGQPEATPTPDVPSTDDGATPGGSQSTPDARMDTPRADPATTPATPGSATTPTADPGTPRAEPRPDPPSDTLGWEQGYWYDDPVVADNTDGLNDTELAAVKYRTMARVERMRGLEFTEDVTVSFVSRSEFEDSTTFSFREDRWRDQYWEAALVVGENRSAASALSALYDAVVDGYFTGNRIVLVSDRPDAPRVSPATLAHELGHAVTSQALRWNADATNRDASLAVRGVTEGDPNSLDALYQQRCRENWSCLDGPERDGAAGGLTGVDEALYVRFAMPYTIGPDFVAALREAGGWETVNAAYGNPPESTEQVIHPRKYATDPPVEVTVPDRSDGSWGRFRGRTSGAGTFGEATLYAILLHNGVIDAGPPAFNVAQRTGLNYSDPATAGWGGDSVVPYANGSGEGYVWKSVWDTERDARQFRAAYLAALRSKGAREVRENVYRIPDGPFADAFRVVRRDRTLVVVNAPRVAQLDDVHAPRDG